MRLSKSPLASSKANDVNVHDNNLAYSKGLKIIRTGSNDLRAPYCAVNTAGMCRWCYGRMPLITPKPN